MNAEKRHPQKLLLFHLNDQRLFGIGTLKVREIIPFKSMIRIPNSHSAVLGTMSFRGSALSVIDTSAAVGYAPIPREKYATCSIAIADVQRREFGFLVRSVSRIVEAEWREVIAPPKSLGNSAYITGIIQSDGEGQLVQLMDVELLLSGIFPDSEEHSFATLTDVQQETVKRLNILLVDDSQVARRQLCDALDHAQASYFVTSDGQQAMDVLINSHKEGNPIDVLVSDIEMPGLDGYELTFETRDNADLSQPYIILHTSLNSEMSVSYAKQVGADEALTKFDANELLQAILRAPQCA